MLIGGVDAGVLAAALPLMPAGMRAARIPRDDIAERRAAARVSDGELGRRFGIAPGVSWSDTQLDGPAGALRVRIYSPAYPPVGTLLYLHGGGFVLGTIEGYDARCSAWAAGTGFEVLSVDYRLAPEHPFPAALDDAMTALAWAHERTHGRRPLGIAGDSAGGGLAATTVLRNRAEGVARLAFQALVYPMLDNRTVEPDPRYAGPFVSWSVADNAFSWHAYLGADCLEAPPFAAAARAGDLAGLPPTYLDTGTLDLFHDEDIAFAHRLIAAGVVVDGHVWNGAPHGFDVIAPRSSLGRAAWSARFSFVRTHADLPSQQ